MLKPVAALVGVVCMMLAMACGQSTTATKATPSVAGAPAGGPVPAQLQGDWLLPAAASAAYVESAGGKCPEPLAVTTCTFKLTLTATTYDFTPNVAGFTAGGGDVVVNGTEIDFFNGHACHLALPGGVGRYTWTLTSSVLRFTALNTDSCPRAPILVNQSYTRSS
jgi:hypothetical protein